MFKQVDLKYAFNALEPHIDELTMITHYTKHHAAYTNNLNAALEKLPGLSGKSIEDILSNLSGIADPALRSAVQNNGGGYYNHNLYFSILSPDGAKVPAGALAERIYRDFVSFAAFKDQISAAAAGRFGSGWAWLNANGAGELQISSSPNQDNPLMDGGGWPPILGIDVWEHAYYLKYKNLRADYIKAFFNVIDWDAVAQRYGQIKA